MANVKSRPKAPKSAATKRDGKLREKPTGDNQAKGVKKPVKNKQNKSETGPDLMKELLSDAACKTTTKTNDKTDHISLNKESLLSKSGRIKKKNKDHLKLLNNILKSELMIQDKSKKKKNEGTPTVNNNDSAISNQNESDAAIQIAEINTENNEKSNDSKIKKKKERSPRNKPTENKPKIKQVKLSTGDLLSVPVFECDHCHKTFSTKSSIRRHIYTHQNHKPYECVQCHRWFSHEGNRQMHIKKFHPEIFIPESYICHICDKSFRLQESLKSHLDVHIHTYGCYKCLYCTQSFLNQDELVRHKKRKHLSSVPLECHICNNSFHTENQLAQHLKEHLNLKGFICKYCTKEYKELSSMRRHVQISHGGRRLQCPVCNKKLKGHLSEHMRVHEQRRPHECPECGQRFTQATQLNVHRRGHTGDRPYPCRICGNSFSHSNALMLHVRRHTGEKPFPCALCPLHFSQLPHMKAHMRNIHGQCNAYRCTKCGQFFKLKVQLETHEKNCALAAGQLPLQENSQPPQAADSSVTLSRMRFLLALLLTMIASQDKLRYLGFNKRLIDDLLIESLEAMGKTPCKDESLTELKRLTKNIDMLLIGTVPKDQMTKFREERKTTEELLELLTDDKKLLKRYH